MFSASLSEFLPSTLPVESQLDLVLVDDIEQSLPVRMLHDRVLVKLDAEAAERRSASGIVIPATAQMGKRLSWADVVATGPNVRQVSIGDKVHFALEDRHEVEISAQSYILLRERDVHAVAEPDAVEAATGLYL